MRFIDPKTDYAFKRIFGNENKKEILISFLKEGLEIVARKGLKRGHSPEEVSEITGLTIEQIKRL